jgi:disulfide bond formation protein DsbB
MHSLLVSTDRHVPLSVIIGVAILYRDKFVHRYVLPLTLTGLAVSVYHNLLYWKIIPEADAPCRAGVSCTTKFFEWFGFVTIPFLSLCAFTAITVLVIISWKGQTNE